MNKGKGTKRARNLGRPLCVVVCFTMLSVAAQAQQQTQTFVEKTTPLVQQFNQQSEDEEEKFIVSGRPGEADPAEFQKPGVLQVEYGIDASFRAEEFRSEQVAPLNLRFAASRRLLLSFAPDTLISRTDEDGERQTGVGDTRLGFQALALEDREGQPALAFAYYIKLPTASEAKSLGTGRVDHRIIALVSKKVGKTDIDFNVAFLNIGREDSDRRASGGQAALSFTRELNQQFSFVGEISGQSVEERLQRGIYALGALTYRVNRRVQLDGGLRFGIGAEAPRAGVFAGITVGIADFFK